MTDPASHPPAPDNIKDVLTAHYLLIGFAFGAIYRLDRALFEELKEKATETARMIEKLSPDNACSREILRLIDEFKEPTRPSFSVVSGGKAGEPPV